MSESITVGRYVLHRQIARGGMGPSHIARLTGDEGFSRIVAANRPWPDLAEDTEFVSMFIDEARIASKVHHHNVVPVLDLVTTSDEVMLVQEYVHGVPLHVLLRTAHETNARIPVRIAVSIATQVLAGLHAAHTTVDEMGVPLEIIHRDVSPQNVMVAADGTARLLDFGVAKTTMAAHVTRDGTFKGKLAYSSPEQVRGKPVQQSDLYSLAVVLWELLVGHRLHASAQGEAELVATVLRGSLPTITEALSNEADWGAIDSDEWKRISALDPIVRKGLAANAKDRHASAAEMEAALTAAVPPASPTEVSAWVKRVGKEFLDGRDQIIAAEELSWRKTAPSAPTSAGRLARPATVSTIHTHVTMPQAPRARGGRLVVSILGALVMLLGVGVVYAVQAPESPAQAHAAPLPAPRPVAPPTAPRPVAPPAAAPVAADTAAADPAPVPPPPPAVPLPPVDDSSAAPEPAEVAVKPAIRKRRRAPTATAPSAPAVAVPAEPATSCSPPYYFEGQKKVFKPECL